MERAGRKENEKAWAPVDIMNSVIALINDSSVRTMQCNHVFYSEFLMR